MAATASRKRPQDFPLPSPRDLRPKLLSSIGNVSVSDNFAQKEYSGIIEETPQFDIHTSKPEVQDAYSAPDVVKRSKRLFSSLIGHLGSAKKKLDEDQEIIQRQNTLVRSIAQKSTEEFKKLRERKRKEYELTVRTKRIEERISDIERTSKAWKKHMESLAEFIFTTAAPSIAWLPKFHNTTTTKLLQKRKAEIQSLISQRESEDEQKIFDLKAELAEAEVSIVENDGGDPVEPPKGRRRGGDDDEEEEDAFVDDAEENKS